MTSTSATALALLQRLQRGLSTVELIHVPHERWPLLHRARKSPAALRISVLDSSFNPPTLAHLALANTPPHEHESGNHDDYEDYDAKLLLLSVRNADKALKPSDATYIQRLEMMVLFAADVSHSHPPLASVSGTTTESLLTNNVAVAIIDEPTFVGKSSTLLAFLRRRLSCLSETDDINPRLTFLQGFDTLERLFSPRYYPSEQSMHQSLRTFFSPDGDDSRVVCARRVSYPSPHVLEQAQEKHQEEYERERRTLNAAKDFIDAGRVVLVDIGDEERTFSSSEVRDKIARGDEGWKRFLTSSVADYVVQKRLYLQQAQL